MSMSMEVCVGYGVLFGKAGYGDDVVSPRGEQFPWHDEAYDYDVQRWWGSIGGRGRCPVVEVGGGFDGGRVTALFLARTCSDGRIVCPVKAAKPTPQWRTELSAFLRKAGLTVPRAALFGWWALGDFTR